jgi:hypothetical protein
MRNAVAISVLLGVTAISGVLGAAAPVGICVTIWRYSCVESLIGPTSDRSHPASWIFLALQIPSGLISIAGALTLCLFLLHFFPSLTPETDPRGRRLKLKVLNWERRCAVAWRRHVRYELRRLGASGNTAGNKQITTS